MDNKHNGYVNIRLAAEKHQAIKRWADSKRPKATVQSALDDLVELGMKIKRIGIDTPNQVNSDQV